MKKAVVSVCMITYNHVKFISEAIEGVLKQEVDFEVELIIADDCSTDGTEEIVQNFCKNHPKGDWIKYHRHAENKGMMPNFIWALQRCEGEYVALCEGDDYWCDSSKLKCQVEFLSQNPDCILSFHDALFLFDNGRKRKFSDKYYFLNREDNYYTIVDLQRYKWFIPTCSIVYRNLALPQWLSKSSIGDFSLQLILSDKGRFHFKHEILGVYRIHPQGISNFVNSYFNRLNDISLWFWNVRNISRFILLRWYFSVLWRLALKNCLNWFR
ncbi:MAG: glycosyltransferase [Cyclobacteriaceae bacterium]|nr:glycosyltransferase [Cyclobacteriaceae bacterium]